MRKYLLIIFIFLSCSGGKITDYKFDDDGYFPLHVGNQWKYQKTSGNLWSAPDTFTVAIMGMKKIDKKAYYIFNQFYITLSFKFEQCYMRMDDKENVYLHDGKTEELRYSFNVIKDSQWEYKGCIYRYWGNSYTENIIMGNFENCAGFSLQIGNSNFIDETLANNIGVVKIYVVTESLGENTYELLEAIINGEKFSEMEIEKINKHSMTFRENMFYQ